MAADEAHQPEVHDEDLPFAQRAEALFDTIAAKDGVESEFVEALVTAVAFLGLKVNEPQVTKALHQVAQATENRLSKVEFVRFCENLRVQLPSTGGSHAHDVLDSTGIRDPDDSTLDGGDNGNTTTAYAEGPSVEAGPAVTWSFEPSVSLASLQGDARELAEKVYATVEQGMMTTIH